MGKVLDFSWSVQIELNRAQIVSLSKLSVLIRNFKDFAKKEFPGDCKGVNWPEVENTFKTFAMIGIRDREFYDKLVELVNNHNSKK